MRRRRKTGRRSALGTSAAAAAAWEPPTDRRKGYGGHRQPWKGGGPCGQTLAVQIARRPMPADRRAGNRSPVFEGKAVEGILSASSRLFSQTVFRSWRPRDASHTCSFSCRCVAALTKSFLFGAEFIARPRCDFSRQRTVFRSPLIQFFITTAKI